jgi:hypothetical protein
MYQDRLWTRLIKHVSVARQQILNNATVEVQQWKMYAFYVVHVDKVCLVTDSTFGIVDDHFVSVNLHWNIGGSINAHAKSRWLLASQ